MEKIYANILKLKIELDEGFKEYAKKIDIPKPNPVDKIKLIETKMERLLDSYLNGIIDIETYRNKNNSLLYELELAKKELKESNIDNDIVSQAYEYVKNTNLETIIKDLDFEAKRRLVHYLLIKLMFIQPHKESVTTKIELRLNGKYSYNLTASGVYVKYYVYYFIAP